jgi:ribonuclease E
MAQGPEVAGGERPDAGDGGEGRRRRRRGGRGRGRDGAEGSTELGADQGSDQGAEGQYDLTAAAAEHTSVSESVAPAPAWSNEASTGAEAVAPVPPASASVDAAVAPVAAEAPQAASSAHAPAPAPATATPFVLPVDTLQALAAQAGLQWVHSDAGKVQAAQEAIANTPKPVHVPRTPKPRAVVDEGPLVLVETRKDLSQVRMPFDQA